jgi:hypothetical protein
MTLLNGHGLLCRKFPNAIRNRDLRKIPCHHSKSGANKMTNLNPFFFEPQLSVDLMPQSSLLRRSKNLGFVDELNIFPKD